MLVPRSESPMKSRTLDRGERADQMRMALVYVIGEVCSSAGVRLWCYGRRATNLFCKARKSNKSQICAVLVSKSHAPVICGNCVRSNDLK